MSKRQMNVSRLPVPSSWYITLLLRGRNVNHGTLFIHSIANNIVTGSIDLYVGGSLPIEGQWDERRRRLTFRMPNAIFVGTLSIRDEYQPGIRHFILRGTWNDYGDPLEYGTWLATTALYF